MIKYFKNFNWFSPLFKYVAAGGLMENFKKKISNWFSPFSCLRGSGGFLEKIQENVSHWFSLKVVFFFRFFFNIIFFSPLFVDIRESAQKKRKEKKSPSSSKQSPSSSALPAPWKAKKILSAGPSSSARFPPWSCPLGPLWVLLWASESQYESHNSSCR